MAKKEKWFASPLPTSVKFITALQLTSLQYTGRRDTIHRILMCLMGIEKEDFTDKQFNILTHYKYGEQRSLEIRDFFQELYNNEEELCAYLNREISMRYFKRNRKPGEKEVDVIVRNIVNENLADLLDF